MREPPLSREAKKELAVLTVHAMYSGFEVELLERILEVGQMYEYAGKDEVLFMNEALAAEIEQRKAGR